jgi:hypothetical protein
MHLLKLYQPDDLINFVSLALKNFIQLHSTVRPYSVDVVPAFHGKSKCFYYLKLRLSLHLVIDDCLNLDGHL